jgi:hypothetical protein
MDLYLRKVDHTQARYNFRVVLKIDDEEIDIGSVGLKTFTSDHTAWTWGTDTVVPLRAHQSEGNGTDLKQCKNSFRAAWEFHCEDEAAARPRARNTRPMASARDGDAGWPTLRKAASYAAAGSNGSANK